MFRNWKTYMADTGAQGAPPVPASAPATTTTGAGTAPAASQIDMAKLVAEAVKAQVSPLLEQLNAAKTEAANERSAREKSEQEKATSVAKVATAEEQVKALRDQFHRAQSESTVHAAMDRFQYVSPEAKGLALTGFQAAFKVEVRDNGEIVATAGGKSQPVEAAYGEWFGKHGGPLKAAAAQPGPGAPPPAGAEGGTQRKSIKEMTREEFSDFRRKGVTLKLTNDARSPSVTFKDRSIPRVVERREALLAGARGLSASK